MAEGVRGGSGGGGLGGHHHDAHVPGAGLPANQGLRPARQRLPGTRD